MTLGVETSHVYGGGAVRIKLEVGVLRDEQTVWPAEYRTWSSPEQAAEALAYLIGLAERETITGFRTGRETT